MSEVEKRVSERKEEGASLVEYALLVALIAVVCIIAIRVIGTQASSSFSNVSSAMRQG